MNDSILYELDNGLATITLNRPDKLNAFDDPMLAALEARLKEAERDAAVRVIVITGSGRGFSAGQDLAAVREREGGMSFREHLEQTYNRVILRIRSVEKPVVGGINGVAAGAGMSLALACDLRLVSAKASFIQSFVGVGLVPDSGSTWFLPRMIGYPRAFELAITADRLSAADALAMGLVNRVVTAEDFEIELSKYARRFASAPTLSIGLTKRAMNRAMARDLESSLAYEAQMQEIAGQSEDHAEGVAAFLDKRSPRFEGR